MAKVEGIIPTAVAMRLKRGKYPGLEIHRQNARVVNVEFEQGSRLDPFYKV